ncbi:hypothetical protein N7523_005466 [Penicillium sp. IBT 18751x]|nr:hypothetical protein N7523_005466 [Penicillium sp. IBT 18751x]
MSTFWTQPEGLQPHGLLSQQAIRGSFSLQNVLSTHPISAALNGESRSISGNDPVVSCLINHQVALSLFDNFMTKLNPYVSQLDPELHSFAYVRHKSSFLFTTVLAAASKAFDSALYHTLHAHAEELFSQSLRQGKKSTESVQAILILTYWKEPNDARAWMSLGLAIRMGLDLNWHVLTPHGENLTDSDRREARNVERTWLVLFVYDRSFVSLRLLAADAFECLRPFSSSQGPLLSSLQRRIDSWESKWTRIIELGIDLSNQRLSNTTETCHSFMIQFYGAHLRLQLFSLPLQDTISNPKTDEPAEIKPFWISYESALSMLRLVTESSSLLYLAQDSIHVMTAYAAIFLMKVGIMGSKLMTVDMESTVLRLVDKAAAAFNAQSAPHGSSCTLQARFLENLLAQYRAAQDWPTAAPRTRDPTTVSGDISSRDYSSHQAMAIPRTTSTAPTSSQVPGPTTALNDTSAHIVAPKTTLPDSTVASCPLNGVLETPELSDERTDLLYQEEMWIDLVANAGFDLHDGIFYQVQ